jgi:histidine kinase
MSLWRRLSVRLLVSYLLVVAVGSAVMFAVGRLVAPNEFQRRLRLMGQGRGSGGSGASSDELQQLVVDAFDTALLIGVIAAVVASGFAAVLVTRRVLRPINSVRDAADGMARGDYHRRVPLPAEEELAALAHDVNTLAATLEETEQRRARLIGEVAHEMRSPLTTIGGYMEALLDGVRQPDEEIFVIVAEEAARLHRLADDLTVLSQAEEGALPLDPVLNDLGELGQRAADRLRSQFEHGEVELRLELSAAPVMADSDRMTQVFINLLGNALTHTSPGGVVTVMSGTSSNDAWADITDTGRGIPEEQLDRVFERFYRLPDPDHPAGRGIGLTIARSIVRAQGGDIVATSAGPGTGATFRVTLPTW